MKHLSGRISVSHALRGLLMGVIVSTHRKIRKGPECIFQSPGRLPPLKKKSITYSHFRENTSHMHFTF